MHNIPTCNVVFQTVKKKAERKKERKRKKKVKTGRKTFYQLIYNSRNICYTNRVFKMAAISGRKILNFTHFFSLFLLAAFFKPLSISPGVFLYKTGSAIPCLT